MTKNVLFKQWLADLGDLLEYTIIPSLTNIIFITFFFNGLFPKHAIVFMNRTAANQSKKKVMYMYIS